MEVRILTINDCKEIANLKYQELLENSQNTWNKEDIDNFLKNYLYYLKLNLNSNLKIYGVFIANQLVAFLSQNIISRVVGSYSLITDMYTHPSFRNQHLQSEYLIPLLTEENFKMNIGLNEIETPSSCNEQLKHLLKEKLLLTSQPNYYLKEGLYSKLPSRYQVELTSLNPSTYLFSLIGDNQLHMQAVADVTNTTPTLSSNGQKVYINITYRRLCPKEETIEMEKQLLNEIVKTFNKNADITTFQVDGESFYKETLKSLGFVPRSYLRGANVFIPESEKKLKM